MAGPADANRLAAGCDDLRDRLSSRQNQRKWTGPEGAPKATGQKGPAGDAPFRHRDAANMNDDRITGRPAFKWKWAGPPLRFQSVRRQAVDRFRWDCNDLAGAKQFRRSSPRMAKQLRRIGGQDLCNVGHGTHY